MSEDESFLRDATIFLNPGGFFGGTDRVGSYAIAEVPAGTYQLSACHSKWGVLDAGQVVIEARAATVKDLTLPEPAWPAELQNPDFEIYGEKMGIMAGWKPYGINDGDGAVKSGWMEGWSDPDSPGFQARTGEGLFGYVSAYNTKTGCSYQTIQAEANALYELSAYIYTCRRGGTRGDVVNRIGVDPMGLDDPNSPYIVWSPYRESPDRWSQLQLQARANRNKMTILLGHKMVSGIQCSGNFFDDVELRKIAGPEEGDEIGTTQGGDDAHLPIPLR
jgi:hypothetical protein